jgi:glucose/mannose-6-phosphate isomerase
MEFSFNEAVLDDPDALAAGDPSDMLRAVATSGAQIREMTTYTAEAGIEVLAEDRPRAVILSAVGSSAAACEVLRALVGDDVHLPLIDVPGPVLPRWVGPLDLVIAVSRSGTAQPTLSVVAEAGRRGCRVVTVAAPGSPLAHACDRVHGLHIPADRAARHTRASLWALVTPLLAIADLLGLAVVPAEELALAADRLDKVAETCRPSSESFVNPAKQLALEIAGSIPVIWGAGQLCRTAAKRFARQLHANAKYPALDGGLQEAAHGSVALFDGPFATSAPSDIFYDPLDSSSGPPFPRLRVVLLRDAMESPPDAALRAAAETLATDRGIRLSEILADAGQPLERLAQFIALGDFASIYLALGLGVDPGATPAVLEMKDRVSQLFRGVDR